MQVDRVIAAAEDEGLGNRDAGACVQVSGTSSSSRPVSRRYRGRRSSRAPGDSGRRPASPARQAGLEQELRVRRVGVEAGAPVPAPPSAADIQQVGAAQLAARRLMSISSTSVRTWILRAPRAGAGAGRSLPVAARRAAGAGGGAVSAAAVGCSAASTSAAGVGAALDRRPARLRGGASRRRDIVVHPGLDVEPQDQGRPTKGARADCFMPRALRHGVISGRHQGVATADSPRREPAASRGAVTFDRFERIGGAGRIETAVRPRSGLKNAPVQPGSGIRKCRIAPQSFITGRQVREYSRIARPRGRRARSRPRSTAGRLRRCIRNDSRTTRRIRLRATALPTARADRQAQTGIARVIARSNRRKSHPHRSRALTHALELGGGAEALTGPKSVKPRVGSPSAYLT